MLDDPLILTLLALAGGLVLLVAGGELLVRGSVRVAERLGVSSLIIGLTLVGFGTSMPELVTSVEASLRGVPGIAIGNIAGSNIANTLLILGIAALIAPMAVSRAALTRDGSFVIAATAAFVAAGFTIGLTRLSGALFVAGLIGYMLFAYHQEKPRAVGTALGQPIPRSRPDKGAAFLSWLLPIGMALAGLAIIIGGGKLLVGAAVDLARVFGMSESVIGLTVVAVGTSLPEMVTSVIAAIRRHTDIAVGNVLGSNIYNVLGIGGVTGLIAPTAFPPEMLGVDLLVLMGSAVLLYIVAHNGTISRLEGALMLAGYIGYTTWLVVQ